MSLIIMLHVLLELHNTLPQTLELSGVSGPHIRFHNFRGWVYEDLACNIIILQFLRTNELRLLQFRLELTHIPLRLLTALVCGSVTLCTYEECPLPARMPEFRELSQNPHSFGDARCTGEKERGLCPVVATQHL